MMTGITGVTGMTGITRMTGMTRSQGPYPFSTKNSRTFKDRFFILFFKDSNHSLSQVYPSFSSSMT